MLVSVLSITAASLGTAVAFVPANLGLVLVPALLSTLGGLYMGLIFEQA